MAKFKIKKNPLGLNKVLRTMLAKDLKAIRKALAQEGASGGAHPEKGKRAS